MGSCNFSSYDPLGNLCIMYTSCSHVTDEYCSACSSGHRDCPVQGGGDDGSGSNNSTGSYGGENNRFSPMVSICIINSKHLHYCRPLYNGC
jgi:hypothetical protein